MTFTKSIKGLLVFVVAMFFVCSFGAYALTGTGTSTDPYVLTTAEDLQSVCDLCGDGVYFKLGADIVLNDSAKFVYDTYGNITSANGASKWTYFDTFEGVFDGAGYNISGLYCESGFFGKLNNATIKNVNFDNAFVNVPSLTGFTVAKGGVLGTEADNTVIKNCKVVGTIKDNGGNTQIGGFIGSLSQTSEISDSISYASVVSNNAGVCYVGGIVGKNEGEVDKCNFAGSVTATSPVFEANAGGIAGVNEGVISGCFSEDATISVSSTLTGALANAGGIVGKNLKTVKQCKNTSSVNASCTDAQKDYTTSGGIVGYNQNADITNCENAGVVESNAYAGGVAGVFKADSGAIVKLEDCLNNGSVTAFSNGVAGGIIGYLSATDESEVSLTRVLNAKTADNDIAGTVTIEVGDEITQSYCYKYSDYTVGESLAGLSSTVWVFTDDDVKLAYSDGLAKESLDVSVMSELVHDNSANTVLGTVTVKIYNNKAGMNIISSIFEGNKYCSSKFAPVGVEGTYKKVTITFENVTVSDNASNLSVNVMFVNSLASVAPVIENIIVEI